MEPSSSPDRYPSESAPSSPPSPRKRRMWLRSSDETSGEMTIEDYIYGSDDYRKTTALPRLPLPLLESRIWPHLRGNRLEEVRGPIDNILSSSGLQNYHASIVCLRKTGYTPSFEVPTLRVWVRGDRTLQWPQIRDTLKECLNQHDLPNIEVEIFHPDKCYLPSLFSISPSHPSINIYNSIRDQLLKVVDQKLRTAWLSMCIYKIGNTEDVAEFAVVVYVAPFTYLNWKSLKFDLDRIIRPHLPHDLTIGVEFLPGHVSLTDDDLDTTSGLDQTSELSRVPIMGSSFGIRGRESSGTLGCFVKLTVGDKIHHGVLTNYHVVEPLQSAPEKVKLQAARYGASYFASVADIATTAIFPSQEDSMATQKAFRKGISNGHKMITDIRREIEEREEIGRRTDGLRVELKSSEIGLNSLQLSKPIVDSIPITLGKVLVSSGKLVGDNNMFIDWAFIELKKDAAKDWIDNQNILPSQQQIGLVPCKYGIDENYIYTIGSGKITNFSKMEKGNWCFKTGRSTGITTGICHGTEAFVKHIGKNLSCYNSKGEKMQLKNTVIKSWIVIGKYTSYATRKVSQGDFCASGDSGAAVIDARGRAAGLLYGSLTGLCGAITGGVVGAGFVCSMDEVVASIERAATSHDKFGNVNGPRAELTLLSS
ncbi:MAG: hypothetical protein M1834_005485 [Cirrosporium novae-zelandiae]|nr:MAG: hypothetical protein M1834_005485 [Cirrosporium novae-zelandiae]